MSRLKADMGKVIDRMLKKDPVLAKAVKAEEERSKLRGLVCEFKVYPNKAIDKCYWDVMVFKDRGAMRRACRELSPPECIETDAFGAIVMPVQTDHVGANRKVETQPSLGYVLFARTQIGAETVSHEAVHMALHYFRHAGINPNLHKSDTEESLAYAVGLCSGQVVAALWKHGAYDAIEQ